MRLDELTKYEIAKFKKADCFYVIIEPAPNQYEVVKLTKDEVEFDEYDEPSVLHEPEKFKHDTYWFDDEDEANEYVKTLRRLDKLSKETLSLLKQTDEFLEKVKNKENEKQQTTKEETLFEETERELRELGSHNAWSDIVAIHVRDFERHSKYHRISIKRFKELSNFTYDHYNPYLTTDGDNEQVIYIIIFMNDGTYYRRDCIEEDYQCKERWMHCEVSSGHVVPNDLPVEDDFIKRLWTNNYEERCDIPHDESEEVRDDNPQQK